jgi:hypothetical protein
MVWCATKQDDSSDIVEDDQASKVLVGLLSGVFRMPVKSTEAHSAVEDDAE